MNYTGLVDTAHTTVLFSINAGTGSKKTVQVIVSDQISLPVVAFSYQGSIGFLIAFLYFQPLP